MRGQSLCVFSYYAIKNFAVWKKLRILAMRNNMCGYVKAIAVNDFE